MWPFEASTEKPRPRNFVSVRDFAGDSTITSDLPFAPSLFASRAALAPDFAARFAGADLPPDLARVVLRALPFVSAGTAARAALRGFDSISAASGGSLVERAPLRTGVAVERSESSDAPDFGRRLVREVPLTLPRFVRTPAVTTEQCDLRRHFAREIDADRTNAAGRQSVEHALELIGV